MMFARYQLICVFLVISGNILTLGCGRIGFEAVPLVDTTSDTLTDTGTGTDTDTFTDTGTDTGVDTGTDRDTGTDTGIDTDTQTDTGTDTGTDADTDTNEACAALPSGTELLSATDLPSFSVYGEVSRSIEPVSGQSFNDTWRVASFNFTQWPYDARMVIEPAGDISIGDHLYFEYWTRCVSSSVGVCQTSVQIERNTSPWTKMMEHFFSTGPGAGWVQHQVPFVSSVDYAQGNYHISYRLGYDQQSVEISPIRLVNYGPLMTSPRVDCLPDNTTVYSDVEIVSSPRLVVYPNMEYLYLVEANGFPPPTFLPSGIPSWLTIDASNDQLNGVPGYGEVGSTAEITIEATNDNGSDIQTWQIDVQLDPALVGHWPLDENSGTAANDASGNGRDGEVFGDGAWQPTGGQVGGSISFDSYTGEVDYIELPNVSALNNLQNSSYTLSVWVKPNSTPVGTTEDENSFGYGILVKSGENTGLWYGNDGIFYATHTFDSGSPLLQLQAASTQTYLPGTFHHLAVVFNKEYNIYSLYIDGGWVDYDTMNGDEIDNDFGTTPWRIGLADPLATQFGLFGDVDIDDVRIYNRTLNTHEISNLAGQFE